MEALLSSHLGREINYTKERKFSFVGTEWPAPLSKCEVQKGGERDETCGSETQEEEEPVRI